MSTAAWMTLAADQRVLKQVTAATGAPSGSASEFESFWASMMSFEPFGGFIFHSDATASSTAASVSRDDDEYRYTLGFQHDFRSGVLNHWSLQGSWLYTDNHSNVAIYDYERHQVSLGLWRRF